MVEALNAASHLGVCATWFSTIDSERIDSFIDRADVLVLCRARYNAVVDQILSRAKIRNIPVLFDVDDLIFDLDYVPLIVDALDQNVETDITWDNWFGAVSRLQTTLRRCDGAITTNQYLVDRISAVVPNVTPRVVPNFLNRAQQERSCAIFDAKWRSEFKRDYQIHIGYFSGTPTHNHDFSVVLPAIAVLMDEDPRIVLRVVGHVRHAGVLARHRDRIETFPLQDFVNLQGLIGEVEINVAPLQNNIFTNCKSELKYFEAAVVGTLTIASPTYTFANSIVDGQNGYLACAHEWESKLDVAINLLGTPKKYAEIAKCAHEQAISNYGWDQLANKIVSALFG